MNAQENGADARRTWIAALAIVAVSVVAIVAPPAAPFLAPLAGGAGFWLARQRGATPPQPPQK